MAFWKRKPRKAHTVEDLHNAVKEHDASRVQSLLSEGLSVDAAEPDGSTALFTASRNGDLDIVNLLLHNGADANALSHGATALFPASSFGHLEVVKALVEHGADANTVSDGDTPLHYAAGNAARSNTEDVVMYLITQGAGLNARTRIGRTPLMRACGDGGTLTVARLLIDRGADVNAQDMEGTTALHQASIYGCCDIAQLLLANGASVDALGYKGRTALHMARERGHSEVVELLEHSGADRTAKDDEGHEASAVVSEDDILRLIGAAAIGDIKEVERFLRRGVDASVMSRTGEAPIIGASLNGQGAMVEFLLANGVDDHTPALSTALFCACEKGHVDIAELLLQKGANINAKEQSSVTDMTPLMVAALSGHSVVVKMLLGRAPATNQQHFGGGTALHLAASAGHGDIVQILLNHGADVSVVTNSGENVLEYARERGQENIVGILERWEPSEEPHSGGGSSSEQLTTTIIGAPGTLSQPFDARMLIPTSDRGGDAEERASVAIGAFGRRHPDIKVDVVVETDNDGMVFQVDLRVQDSHEANALGRELVDLLRYNGFRITKLDRE